MQINTRRTTKERADVVEIKGTISDRHFSIFETSIGSQYDVYMSDEVEQDSREYTELLKFFNMVSENDRVNLHMGSYGGSCQTGFRIAHAMQNSAAPIIVHVEAPNYSMGAFLSLCGTYAHFYPGAFLMFHNYSGGRSGKGGELAMSIEEWSRHFKFLLNHFCRPFLTAAEVNRLNKDGDVYIHHDDKDLKKRLERHFKVRIG